MLKIDMAENVFDDVLVDVIKAGLPAFKHTTESVFAATMAAYEAALAEVANLQDSLEAVPAAFRQMAEESVKARRAALPPAPTMEQAQNDIALLIKAELADYLTTIKDQLNIVRVTVPARDKSSKTSRFYKVVDDRIYDPEQNCEIIGFTADNSNTKTIIASWALPEGHKDRDAGSWLIGYTLKGQFREAGRVNKITSPSNLMGKAAEIWGLSSWAGVNGTPLNTGSNQGGTMLDRVTIAELVK